MAKKMTSKEFWTVLEKVGYPKDIYGYDGLINLMSCFEWSEGTKWRERGNETMARISEERAKGFHDALLDFDEHYYD